LALRVASTTRPFRECAAVLVALALTACGARSDLPGGDGTWGGGWAGTYGGAGSGARGSGASAAGGTGASAAGGSGGAGSKPRALEVSDNEFVACFLTNQGKIVCWGDSQRAYIPAPDGTFKHVSVGDRTCAIRDDDTLLCLGQAQVAALNTTPAGTFRQISSGWDHACAIDAGGALTCWGDPLAFSPMPDGTFTEVEARAYFTCAIRDDHTLACWGDDAGLGNTSPPAGRFIHVAISDNFGCAIREDGTLACWGDNTVGQCNPPKGTFTQLSCATDYCCAIRTDGTPSCWGWQAMIPVGVSGLLVSISAAVTSTCAATTSGAVKCWYSPGYQFLPPPPPL
jgi:alpha-tubulin suppressor-like RCC1 family protein